MKIRTSALLLTTLTIAACGGGGGGGGDNGGDDNGGGSDAPVINGTAKIVFPRTGSAATAQTVSVRGLASDPDGVAGVSVNGVAATIAEAGGGEDGEVQWSANIQLHKGENVLLVSVEDDAGTVSSDADETTIEYVEVPTMFTLDSAGARIVGLTSDLTGWHVVQQNYDTLEQTVFATDIWGSPSETCFRQFENEFLYLSFLTGTWELREFDLTTQQDSLIVEISDADLDPGPGYRESANITRLICGGTHTSAYVLANYSFPDGSGLGPLIPFGKSRVLEIELATKLVTTLSETTPGESPAWVVRNIALAEDSIVAISGAVERPLTSIALSTGLRTNLAPGLEISGDALDPVLEFNRVYVATSEGVDEIDLSGVPTGHNISVVEDSDPLAFIYPNSIAFDPANNRVIVGDFGLDALIAVDVTTGERSELISRRVGTGISLRSPRAFALSADGNRAYVADDGGNGPAHLFEIDLATGARQVVGDISQSSNPLVSGLALDEAGDRVFVSIGDIILEVNLESEEVQTIASIDTTVLGLITDIGLDIDNDRLLVSDFVNDAIFALNLTTHAIDVISQETVRGTGPAFGGAVSLTLAAATSELYVAGQTEERIVRVNLETGDREELVTDCSLDTSENLQQVLYNETANELVINDTKVHRLDLATGQCVALPSLLTVLRVRVTPENQMLAGVFGALVQIDRETGEVVLISK